MALKIGLLGSSISHSKMPQLQRYLGQLVNIEIEYSLIEGLGRAVFDPAAEIRSAISGGFHGLNVTHPYKQQVCGLVDEACVGGHEVIGSYNTLLFKENRVFGANTDYSGFMQAYLRARGGQPPGRVFLCGAGGVGRAVAMALKSLGCTDMTLYDLVRPQAESLASLLMQHGVTVRVIGHEDLAPAIEGAGGLVNCTALGMFRNPGSAIDLSLVGAQQWAFDAVYTPLNTDFLTRCRQSGMQCISGFDLWIFQGLDAFRIFTGMEVKATDELMAEALNWLD